MHRNYSDKSLPIGLKEEDQFLPQKLCHARKVSSADDVARYHRYFTLVQRNLGKSFKWKHYAKILHNGFRNFKAPTIPKKVLPYRIPSSVSESSSYATACKSASSRATPILRKKCRQLKLENTLCSPDTVSNSSPLLKVCRETKNIVRDIYKKVEKISSLQPKDKFYGTPKGLNKKKRHHVITVERIGDTIGVTPPLSKRGKSSDTETEYASSTPMSTPNNGTGDRKRYLRRRSCHRR